MSPQTFIFIGRSGCGKGTQGKLLEEYLAANDPGRKIRYQETGLKFRKLITGASHTSKLAKELYDSGGLQPAFLAVWSWASDFVEELTGEEHIIFDGSPRTLVEAQVLDSAFVFYKMKPFILFLDVHTDTSHTRLKARGRMDDVDREKVQKRLDWYERDVVPAIDYFRASPHCTFLRINGDQTIPEVHKEIIEKIGLTGAQSQGTVSP